MASQALPNGATSSSNKLRSKRAAGGVVTTSPSWVGGPSPLALLSSLLLLVILVIGCCIGPVMAQDNPIRYVRADELRDHSGQCFDASRCSLREVGEEWTVHRDCERATCQVAVNGTLMEKRTRCREPSPILSEDCYILRVEGRPFPHCCPKLFCNDKPVTPELVK